MAQRFSSTSPNLLLIVTDQQARSTVAAYGNDRIQVPRMNALAERSTVFDRAYCAQPVCGPARACLFTGTWPHHNGQVTLGRHPMHDHIPCLTDMLDDRWVCGFFGRSGSHRYADGPAPRAGGIDELDFNDIAPDHLLRAHGLTPVDGVRFGKADRPAIPEHLGGPSNIAAKACDFIRRHAGRPFALTLCFYEPHDPLSGPLDDLHPFDQVPLPDNWHHPPGPDQPRKALLEHLSVLHHRKDGIALRSELAWRLLIQRYWGLCTQVDRALGRVFDQLDASGAAGDTLVILTADHGELAGSHQLFGKNLMYEESIGVPLLISRPGQRRDRHVHAPVGHVDIVPTVLDELGVAAPEHLQGTSLTPWLDGADPPPRPAFVEWTDINYLVHEDLKRDPLPDYLAEVTTRDAGLADLADAVRCIVTPEGWKFCLSPAGQHELYDLNDDPGETANLAFRPEHAERCRDLTARIRDWQVATGDSELDSTGAAHHAG